jgi:DNA adenine methylase
VAVYGRQASVFGQNRIQASPDLTPFIKWPGGKSMELLAIAAAAPTLTGRLIDSFVGGGSVLLATPSEVPAEVNDASGDLIELYRAAQSQTPAFRVAAGALAEAWDGLATLDAVYDELATVFVRQAEEAIEPTVVRHSAAFGSLIDPVGAGVTDTFLRRVGEDLRAKFERMRKIEIKLGQTLSAHDLLSNIEGSVRSALYMSIRRRYNAARLSEEWKASRVADFFFLREFTYAAMFRFNARNQFNVPYGGVSYNRKSLADKLDAMFAQSMVERLRNTRFSCQDFEPFLEEVGPGPADFVFIDPPYDSDFSAYDNMAFDGIDQRRLEATLARLPAKVMVVIKDTPAIRSLYNPDRWHVEQAPKTYMWTIKSRNDRETTHLTITNYDFEF